MLELTPVIATELLMHDVNVLHSATMGVHHLVCPEKFHCLACVATTVDNPAGDFLRSAGRVWILAEGVTFAFECIECTDQSSKNIGAKCRLRVVGSHFERVDSLEDGGLRISRAHITEGNLCIAALLGASAANLDRLKCKVAYHRRPIAACCGLQVPHRKSLL
jgi:hypothetical protein